MSSEKKNILPFEKKTLRFYNFYFEGIDKPLIIEARSKKEAMTYVATELQRRPHLKGVQIRNMKVKTPIFGITSKEQADEVLIWVGFDYTESGWTTEDQFKTLKK